MRLLVITPDDRVDNEARVVNGLFANGLERLHVRKPYFTNDDYKKYLAAIDSQWHKYIVLHNSYELYGEFKLGGIHLNSFSRMDNNVWQQVSHIAPQAISTSFHSWAEIEENTFPYGYIFISPVFDSISKVGYKAGIDIGELQKVKQRLADKDKYCPAITALGGVGVSGLETLYTKGFDGAAMLGAIWQAKEPMLVFKEAIKKVSQLSHA